MQLISEGAATRLGSIVNYSPFTVPECYRILGELHQHRGTRVYLFGLRSDQICELYWRAEPQPDIHDRVALPTDQGGGSRYAVRGRKGHDHAYPLDYSLRSFCEVMFMEPTMSIYIFTESGQSEDEAKVACRSIAAHGLTHVKNKEVPVAGVAGPISVVCGYSQKLFEAREGGILVYWHNVLIMPYHRASAVGEGVVMLAAADHLLADSQKEQFEWTLELQPTLQALVETFETYWNEIKGSNGQVLALEPGEVVDTWVLCDQCQLPRLLPPGCAASSLPVRWCCGSEPLPESRCKVVDPKETAAATAGRILGYDMHGSASSQPSMSFSRGSTFVIIHDSGTQNVLRFRMYAYRVKAITAFGSRGCISLEADRGRFQVEVFRMARPCHPSDDPQNRWVMADDPRTMTFDLAKHKDDLSELTVVGSLQPAGASKKVTAWTMLPADWDRSLARLLEKLKPDESEESEGSHPPSRQLSYQGIFDDLVAKKIEWGSFTDKKLLTERGATSYVYSAKQTVRPIFGEAYRRPVALKMLTDVPQLATDFSELTRLQREISLLSSCSGLDGIITMHGIAFANDEEVPKNIAIVCELKSSNLAQEMQNARQNAGVPLWSVWGETPCLSVLQQIASAMLLLHSRVPMVIHRDLKPSNILVEVDLARTPRVVNVWICDFGLAKEADTQEQTVSQSSVGTPAYRAPELASGGEATFHCDIFSWGMIALQMARGFTASALQVEAQRRQRSWGAVTADCQQLFNRSLTYHPPTSRPNFSAIAQELASIVHKREENTGGRRDVEGIRRKPRAYGEPSVIVYRVLDVTDRPEEGLKAGNPADLSILPYQHVERTSVSRRSSFISTTLDPDWAMWCFAKQKFTHADQSWPGAEIVAINLDMTGSSCNVLDVSLSTSRHMVGASVPRGKDCSVSASEVLLQPTSPLDQLSTPFVPASAIVGVYRIRDMAMTEKKTLYGRLEEGKVGQKGKQRATAAESSEGYMNFSSWRESIGSRLYGRNDCHGVMVKCERNFVPQTPTAAKLVQCEQGRGSLFLGNAASRKDLSWAESIGRIQAIVQVRPGTVGCNVQPSGLTASLRVTVLNQVWYEHLIDKDAVRDSVEPLAFYSEGSESLNEARKWVTTQLAQGHNVLIHSTHANKRAAAFAISCMMEYRQSSFEEVRDLVAAKLRQPIVGEPSELPAGDALWQKVMRRLKALEPSFKVGDRVEKVVRTSQNDQFYKEVGKVVDAAYKGGVHKVKVRFRAGTCQLQSEDNFRFH